MSRFYLFTFLLIAGAFFILSGYADAISPVVKKPTQAEIIQVVLDASSKTDVRAVLLYGLLSQETSLGVNVGKTEAEWGALCASRNTKACRYWKNYDCRNDYSNAKHYDEVLAYLGYDRQDTPTSYTCALGFTQFEPNTWWGLLQRKDLRDLNPWNLADAVLMAAYYLEERGATKYEFLEQDQVIGSSDKRALQQYYCGASYRRVECVGYANAIAIKAARAPVELFRKDLQDQLEIFKEGQEAIKEKFQKRLQPPAQPAPQRKPIFPTIIVPPPPQQIAPPLAPSQPPFQPREVKIPIISPATLKDATLGVVFSTTLSASGGISPYTWAIPSGQNLPDGLTLNPPTGLVSGTPTKSGWVGFYITVTDSIGTISNWEWFGILVNEAPIITFVELPKGLTDVSYKTGLYVNGGTPPYTWRVSSAQNLLPAGLTLDSSTGVISGTPTRIGKYNISITVTDSNSASSEEKLFTLYIVETPTITTKTLPDGKVGIAYNASLSATYGLSPYTWILYSSKNLPDGLVLDSSTGVISGTPTKSGVYYLNIRVNDGLDTESNWASFNITIQEAPSVSTIDLPQGFVGSLYKIKLYANGGTSPYTWTMDPATNLPEGLVFDSGGILLGTPTKSGSYRIIVQVSDTEVTKSDPKSFTLSIVEQPKITNSSALPKGTVGSAYNITFSATGGVSPYTWSLSSDTQKLPDGLTLDSSTGVISGTPTNSGWVGFYITVTDSIGTKNEWQWFSVSVEGLKASNIGFDAVASIFQKYFQKILE